MFAYGPATHLRAADVAAGVWAGGFLASRDDRLTGDDGRELSEAASPVGIKAGVRRMIRNAAAGGKCDRG